MTMINSGLKKNVNPSDSSVPFHKRRQLAEAPWPGPEEAAGSSLPDPGILAQQQPQAALPLLLCPAQPVALPGRHAAAPTGRRLVHGGQGLRTVSQLQLHLCHGTSLGWGAVQVKSVSIVQQATRHKLLRVCVGVCRYWCCGVASRGWEPPGWCGSCPWTRISCCTRSWATLSWVTHWCTPPHTSSTLVGESHMVYVYVRMCVCMCVQVCQSTCATHL